MASLRAIRNRIKSTRSTQKITKAMKLVDAAKLRGAQDAVLRARPYAQLLGELLGSLARSEAGTAPHPLMERREMKRVEVVMLTSDRGLCGGFNSNIVRRAQRFVVEEGERFESMQFSTIGRKGRDFAKKRGFVTRKDYVGFFHRLRFAQAKEVADDLIAEFTSGKIDGAFLLYNQFKSAISQQITLTQLLPIEAPPEEPQSTKGFVTPEHLFEPGRRELLETLIPRQLSTQIWRALLESKASEHGARMTAMDAATKNAGALIGRRSLEYNRARQAAVTKELMESVSGADALQ